ncbi:MAG TPA: PqqD family protein [Thermoanaerobaculia bacterium]|jgi:hypothetical protein
MNPHRTLQPAEGVIFKTVGEELVLLDYDRGLYYGLDPTGARIWHLAAEGKTLGTIVEALTQEYEVERATAEEDLERLVAELEERGLVK